MPTTVLVTLNSAQRQGTYQTGSVVVAADIPRGEVLLVPTIDAADFSKPANSLWIRVYILDGATSTWKIAGGMQWRGGGDPLDPEQQPAMSMFTDQLRGQTIRGELDIPNRMRVGLTVSLVTP